MFKNQRAQTKRQSDVPAPECLLHAPLVPLAGLPPGKLLVKLSNKRHDRLRSPSTRNKRFVGDGFQCQSATRGGRQPKFLFDGDHFFMKLVKVDGVLVRHRTANISLFVF